MNDKEWRRQNVFFNCKRKIYHDKEIVLRGKKRTRNLLLKKTTDLGF